MENLRQFLPGWAWLTLAVLATFATLVGTFLGALTIPEDFRKKVRESTVLGRPVPWWGLLFFALIMAAIAIVGFGAASTDSAGPLAIQGGLPSSEEAPGLLTVTTMIAMAVGALLGALLLFGILRAHTLKAGVVGSEMERLRAWKDHTSDWEDKIDRLERVESTHEGCAGRIATLQKLLDAVPPFYEDQQTMVDAGWGIGKAIRDPDVKHVWFALVTGHHFNGLSEDLVEGRITRMVLAKPGSEFIESHYGDIPDRLKYAVENIHRAYEKAKGIGVKVVVSDFPTLHGILVFKKDSAEDWARIQTPLLPSETGQWPSVVIRRKDNEALFVRVEGAFNALHDAGEPLAIIAEGTEPLGSREPVLRLQEAVGGGQAIKLLCDFVEHSLLPEVTSKNSAGDYLTSLVVPHLVKPLRDAEEEWRMASRDQDVAPVDAQQAFLAMYKAWNDLLGAVEQCRVILGVSDLGDVKGYRGWYAELLEFNESLKRVLSRDDLCGLSMGIEDYHDNHARVTLRLTP